MTVRGHDFNQDIERISEAAFIREGKPHEFVYPSISCEELGEMNVVYVEYERQIGGNRATFPEETRRETRIAGILEEEEYLWIREQLQESDKDFDEPIKNGLMEEHPRDRY